MKSDPYRLENVPLWEAIYGKNLISLGGFAAIENMFSDVNLSGKNALDLGYGLGGVAFYLAEKYHMKIAGVEISSWMKDYAETHAPRHIAHQLNFKLYNEKNEIPFVKNSFDLVYSKGVLNHVKEKDRLLSQVNNILKPNGLFIIADWVYPESNINSSDGPLTYDTESSYQEVLEKTGFTDIKFRNDSEQFFSYVQQFLKNLDKQKQFIVENFGEEIFSEILKQHQDLLKQIQDQSKIAIRIIAKKGEVSSLES